MICLATARGTVAVAVGVGLVVSVGAGVEVDVGVEIEMIDVLVSVATGVDVAVEVDDPDVALDALRDATRGWIADRVIAPEDDGQRACREHVRDALGDLIARLRDVSGTIDVAEIADLDALAKIDAELEAVRSVER